MISRSVASNSLTICPLRRRAIVPDGKRSKGVRSLRRKSLLLPKRLWIYRSPCNSCKVLRSASTIREFSLRCEDASTADMTWISEKDAATTHMLSRRCIDKRRVGYCAVCLALVSYAYGCAIHIVKKDGLLFVLPERSQSNASPRCESSQEELNDQ